MQTRTTRTVARVLTLMLGSMLVIGAVAAAPADTAETTATSATGVADDPLTASERSWLAGHGPIRIGWPQFPPLAMRGPDGEAQGYGVDAWELASLKLGVQVEHIIIGDVATTVAAFRDGAVDMLGGLGPREDLVEGIVRGVPFAWPPSGVVTRTGALSGLSTDLLGATITTIPGSPLEARLPDRYPAATYVPYPDTLSGLQAVNDGDVDAFYGPYAMIGFMTIQNDMDLVPYGEPEADLLPISSAVAQGPPLVDIVTTLRDQLSDGELALIHVKWTGIDLTDPTADTAPAWLATALGGVALIAAVAVAFVIILRRQVLHATAGLSKLNHELEDRVADRTDALQDAATRLKVSNAALQRFAGTAAHDIKGPIAAISGLATLLHRFDLPKDERDDLAQRIGTSALALGGMIDGLLEDATAAGARSASIDGPDLAAWINEVCGPEMMIVGGELRVAVAPGPVETEVEILRRSAVNLVTNAAKYAVNESGMIVDLKIARRVNSYVLTVEDNGPGIPRGMWSKVFERGTRLVDDDRGYGLGLSAIRDLVQGVGGSVQIGEAAELGGASLVVTLPMVAATPEPLAIDTDELSIETTEAAPSA